MNTESEIRKRFDKVIAEAFKPPILVGPNWLRSCPGGKPAPFEFLGAPKMAKASGRDIERVISLIQRRVRLTDLGFRIDVGPRGVLYLMPTGAPADAAKP